VRDPTNPRRVGSLALPGGGFAVAVTGGYAYVATADRSEADRYGLWAVDIMDPQAPREAGSYPLPGWPGGVAARGNCVYVAAGEGGLVILRSRAAVGRVRAPAGAHRPGG